MTTDTKSRNLKKKKGTLWPTKHAATRRGFGEGNQAFVSDHPGERRRVLFSLSVVVYDVLMHKISKISSTNCTNSHSNCYGCMNREQIGLNLDPYMVYFEPFSFKSNNVKSPKSLLFWVFFTSTQEVLKSWPSFQVKGQGMKMKENDDGDGRWCNQRQVRQQQGKMKFYELQGDMKLWKFSFLCTIGLCNKNYNFQFWLMILENGD